jgi:hypothetical protein
MTHAAIVALVNTRRGGTAGCLRLPGDLGQMRQHLPPMSQLARRQAWRDGLEREAPLSPGVASGPRPLDTGPETLKTDGVARANVVGIRVFLFAMHGVSHSPLQQIEKPTRSDLCLPAPVLQHLVLVGPLQPVGSPGQPQFGLVGGRHAQRDRDVVEIELPSQGTLKVRRDVGHGDVPPLPPV